MSKLRISSRLLLIIAQFSSFPVFTSPAPLRTSSVNSSTSLLCQNNQHPTVLSNRPFTSPITTNGHSYHYQLQHNSWQSCSSPTDTFGAVSQFLQLLQLPRLTSSQHTPCVRHSHIRENMCLYHAYTHVCGHTEMILQQLCGQGQMKQQKCSRGHDGIILATVKVETSCSICPEK
ncbi:hypothetical protein DE146DRAFT_20009 [Phaeosphaeria sp. MPI-PUGE-AT-0046c]|nr:hypothetical protein DE146DRAFT_20009 [Phaeosphaeria sp. MPI-PUGE-AT-0046c]